MYQARDLERICRTTVVNIDDELSRVGLFFRVFSRVKSSQSAYKKIQSKGIDYYNGKTKFIRDIIGIRVILYFSDDVSIVRACLEDMFELIEHTVDENEETRFAPTRVNLIFRLKRELLKEFADVTNDKIIDSTFEVQLRTILSEGWHEVDHDLRYKCNDDWIENSDIARNFNGILATLETSEYAILRLFEQLSYRHYRSKNITAMLRTKFRLRFIDELISIEIRNQLNEKLVKDIFKLDRVDVIKFLLKVNLIIPCLLYTSPSPRDRTRSRMPSSA